MIFRLGIREYHYLEKNFEIVLNQNFKLSYLHYSGAYYCIRLNEEGTHWVYCLVDRETKSFYGKKYLTLDWKYCRVLKSYEGIGKFN